MTRIRGVGAKAFGSGGGANGTQRRYLLRIMGIQNVTEPEDLICVEVGGSTCFGAE